MGHNQFASSWPVALASDILSPIITTVSHKEDNLPYCSLDLHTAGNRRDCRLSVTDGVCQHCTCSLCFHLAIRPVGQCCCRDQCSIWMTVICLCVYKIQLNVYLWAIIFAASVYPSHLVYCFEKRGHTGLFLKETTSSQNLIYSSSVALISKHWCTIIYFKWKPKFKNMLMRGRVRAEPHAPGLLQ